MTMTDCFGRLVQYEIVFPNGTQNRFMLNIKTSDPHDQLTNVYKNQLLARIYIKTVFIKTNQFSILRANSFIFETSNG